MSLGTSPSARWRTVIAITALAMVATILALGARVEPAAGQGSVTCYAIADGTTDGEFNNAGTADTLVRVDNALGGANGTIVGTMSTFDAEAMAIRPGSGQNFIWAWDSGTNLVIVNAATATSVAAPFQIPGKVEGLTWANTANNDPADDILYSIQTDGDVLGYNASGVQVFGPTNVTGAGFDEGADIAWDPTTDQLYAIRTNTNDDAQIVIVGGATVGVTSFDLEGLGFTSGGQLIGTTGNDGDDTLKTISKVNGAGVTLLSFTADPGGVLDHEDVDCLDSQIAQDPGVLSATVTGECPGGAMDGKITATVTYVSGDLPANYAVTFSGQPNQSGTLNPGDAPAMAMTGSDLADGVYTVVVTNTTTSTELANQQVTIDCDRPGDPAVSLLAECVNFDGKITVNLSNNAPAGSASVAFDVTVSGQQSVAETLAPGQSSNPMWTALADGTYNVTVLADGVQEISENVPITCDQAPGQPSASVVTECVNGDGKITVNLANGAAAGAASVAFVVTVSGQAAQSVTLAPGGTDNPMWTGLNDGVYAVNVTFDGAAGPSASEVIDCDEPKITIDTTTNGADGVTVVAGDEVKWVYTVMNMGNVPLTSVVVSDIPRGVVGCPQSSLNPGESMMCMTTGIAIAGVYNNIGQVSGAAPDGTTVGDSDPSSYVGNNPATPTPVPVPPTSTPVPPPPTSTPVPPTSTPVPVPPTSTPVPPTSTPVPPPPTSTPAPIPPTSTPVPPPATPTPVPPPATPTPVPPPPTATPVPPPPTATPAPMLATIGNRFFIDSNGNGLQDALEPGVANGTVLLLDMNGATVGSTQTSGTGNYTFANIAPGMYFVQFEAPAGFTFTSQNAGGNDVIDSDANASGLTAKITVAGGQTDNTIDAGVVAPDTGEVTSSFQKVCTDGNGAFILTVMNGTANAVSASLDVSGLTTKTATIPANSTGFLSRTGRPDGTYTVFATVNGQQVVSATEVVDCDTDVLPSDGIIGNRFWIDSNGDGQQDPDEPGVVGATVNLWEADALGNPLTAAGTTATNSRGQYEFTGVDRSKTYVVQFINPNGIGAFTTSNLGSDFTDSDVDGNGISDPVILGTQRVNRTIDAGKTAKGGVVVPPAATPVPPAAPADDGILGNLLWEDTDGDGQQDSNEPGIIGATVNLWTADAAGNPTGQVASTITNSRGQYEFTGVDRSQAYVVQFVVPGRTFTSANIGPDNTDSDAAPSGITGVYVLGASRTNRTIDAGVLPTAQPLPTIAPVPTQVPQPTPVPPVGQPTDGILGNRLWEDTDGDGQQDTNEPGIAGAQVNLWTSDAAGTPLTRIQTTTTNGRGQYEFVGLSRSQTYVVQFVAPGRTFTSANVGFDNLDSDVSAGGVSGPVTLGSLRTNRTIDAGVIPITQPPAPTPVPPVIPPAATPVPPAATPVPPAPADDGIIGNRLWEDTDGDGQQDSNEPGIIGATVNLWTADAAGNPTGQVASTITNSRGQYEFTGVSRNQNYVVQFIAPGRTFTSANVGLDNLDSDAAPSGITGPFLLGSLRTNRTIDAGVLPAGGPTVPPASGPNDGVFGNLLWVDNDANGRQDPNEPGLAGAVVRLWALGATGNADTLVGATLVSSTTTNNRGMYEFTGVDRNETYVVEYIVPGRTFTITNAAGVADNVDSDADSNGLSDPVILGTTVTNRTLDAGVLAIAQPPAPPTPVPPAATPVPPVPTPVPPVIVTGPVAGLGGDDGVAGVVGNRVWDDMNGNGQQDGGEPGVGGVEVILWTSTSDGTPIQSVATTTTDATGLYNFSGLDPNTVYVVQFVAPAGDAFTGVNIGSDISDSDAGPGGVSEPFTPSAVRIKNTIDAGIAP